MADSNLTTLFTNIANSIRTRSGVSGSMYPRQMGNRIRSIKNVPSATEQTTLNGILSDIAVAIRACGVPGSMTPLQMADKVLLIPTQQTSLVIQSEDTFTGKTTYCKAYYNDELVAAAWSITSGGSYATINSNGRVDVVSGTVSQNITISCTYSGTTVTKTMNVSYDNQLTIECADTLTGTSATLVARYNGSVVTAAWSITSGGQYATINSSTGSMTISASGTVVVQATYDTYTTTKTVQVQYVANQQSQTVVNDDGSVTTETQTTTQNQDGSTTTETTSTTTNEDGSYSQTESTTITQQDGSSTTTSTTINQDGTSSETNQQVAADGSSTAQTTNYNSEGDPVSGENVTTDTSGNENTQEVEYDENGDTTVTGYTIDTTSNPNGGETISGGLDTGLIAFDGRGFEIHLKVKMNPANNSNKVFVAAVQQLQGTSKYVGFSENMYKTTDVVGYASSSGSNINTQSFGARITGTPTGSSTNIQTLQYLKSGLQEITMDITYTPASLSPTYLYTVYVKQLYTTSTGSSTKTVNNSTMNSNSGYIPTALDNATVYVGSYGVEHSHDMTGFEVLEFYVRKIS